MIEFLQVNFVYIAAIATAIKWVYEYSNKLKWEKNKFLLDKIKLFFDDEAISNVNRILDWNKTKIFDGDRKFYVTDDILYEALKTHDIKHTFDETEVYIRAIFDKYFDSLTELIFLAEMGLVDKKNLRKFLKYWTDILGGKSKSKSNKLVAQFHVYLDFYGFDTVLKFLK